MKVCCFRFDADTHLCVSVGIPLLVELGDSLGARFTFFVNMGRAFDPALTVAKAFHRLWRGRSKGTMSAGSKLGWVGAMQAAVFNPRAGCSDPAALCSAARFGHEIGLHGGRNHAVWERHAQHWDEARLRGEVETGLRWMQRGALPRPRAFASPCWNSPPGLSRVLSTQGFRFLADTYNPAREDLTLVGDLISIPTNVTAGTGSGGYLETLRLRGWSTGQVVSDFRAQLRQKTRLAVVYDHPFFAGLHALEQVAAMVRVAREEGFSVQTMSAAAETLATGKMPLPCGSFT